MKEIRDWPVFMGVDNLLSKEVLQDALTRSNRGQALMVRCRHSQTAYYRPAMYQHIQGAILDERTRIVGHSNQSLPILILVKDHLSTNPKSPLKLEKVNNALLKLSQDIKNDSKKHREANQQAAS